MIPVTEHNETLSGDSLYSVFLNHEWRVIVVPYVVAGMEKVAASIEDETERQAFESRYGALIDDFYNIVAMTGARVIRATNQSFVAASVWEKLVFSGIVEDDGNYWNAADPTRLTVSEDGMYLVGSAVRFNSGSGSARRQSSILLNNTTIISEAQQFTASQVLILHNLAKIPLVAGDYVELQNLTETALPMRIDANNWTPVLWIERLR